MNRPSVGAPSDVRIGLGRERFMDVAPLHNAPQTVAPSAVSMSAEQQVQNVQLVQAVHAINAAELYGEESELAFVLDRRTRRAGVRLVDRKTRQVIRDVEPDQVLALAETIERG